MKKIADLQKQLSFIDQQVAQQRSLIAMLENQVKLQEGRREAIEEQIRKFQQQQK